MRFMMIVKADDRSEAGILPTEQELADMAKYNEELVKAGVMLAGEGLQASAKGARVRYNGSKRTVIDGPFTEAKEIVAGYWIWECASRDEALEWLKRAPFDGGVEIELREVDDDPRDRRAHAACAQDAPAGAGGDPREGGRLRDPQTPVERIVGEGVEWCSAPRRAAAGGHADLAQWPSSVTFT